MDVEIIQATYHDIPTLQHLIQLYLYDYTEFMDWDVDAHGRFADLELDGRLMKVGRFCFFIKVDGQYAGFAIVDQPPIPPAEFTVRMTEFFILRRYRRRGLGEYFSTDMFNRFRGRWQIAQLPQNVNAISFWRRVIKKYTGAEYEEVITEDGDNIQYFENFEWEEGVDGEMDTEDEESAEA